MSERGVISSSGLPATMSNDCSSSESLLSSEDGAESIATPTNVLSTLEYPESGILLCRSWLGPMHPVQPCQQLASAEQPQSPSRYCFTFQEYKVVTVEKFVEGLFEYSFAYDYWPSGRIKCVFWTRAVLGVKRRIGCNFVLADFDRDRCTIQIWE